MKIFLLFIITVGMSQSALAADGKTTYYSGQYLDFYDLVANLQQEGNLPRKLVLTLCDGKEPGNSVSYVEESADNLTHKVVFANQQSPRQTLELTFDPDWSQLEGTLRVVGAAEGGKIQFWKDDKVEQIGCGS